MGSQTLEILRQGVWASLTGGWFYDPHQGVFCNVVHLYLWLFLLCSPFITYLYFPANGLTWYIYCISTSVTLLIVKLINMALHRLYDRAQTNSEANLKNPFFKVTKETETCEDENGIEMKVMRNDGLRNSQDHDIHEPSEGNSMLSMENMNSIMDLKVDVHRKNSAESIEFMFYASSMINNNQQQDQQSFAGSACLINSKPSLRTTTTTTTNTLALCNNNAVATDKFPKYLAVYPEHESETQTNNQQQQQQDQQQQQILDIIDTTNRQSRLVRKTHDEFRRRHKRKRLERQSSLNVPSSTYNNCMDAHGQNLTHRLTRNQSDSSAALNIRNDMFLYTTTTTTTTTTSTTITNTVKTATTTTTTESMPNNCKPTTTSTHSTFLCNNTHIQPLEVACNNNNNNNNNSNNNNNNVTTVVTTSTTTASAVTLPNNAEILNNNNMMPLTVASNTNAPTFHLPRLRSGRNLFMSLQQDSYLGMETQREEQFHDSMSNRELTNNSILDTEEMDIDLGGSAVGVDNRLGPLQSWILGSSSDVYLEDDSYTKSEFSIEQLDATAGAASRCNSRSASVTHKSAYQLPALSAQPQHRLQRHRHHGHFTIRKGTSNSAIQLPVTATVMSNLSRAEERSEILAVSLKKRRHSNAPVGGTHAAANAYVAATTAGTLTDESPTVRRIKSAALEINCPRPSVSNLCPHPNSVEAINGQQQIKNPQFAMLPPPSKCLVRNSHHLNLCSKYGGSFGGNSVSTTSSDSVGSLNMALSANGSTTALLDAPTPYAKILEQNEHKSDNSRQQAGAIKNVLSRQRRLSVNSTEELNLEENLDHILNNLQRTQNELDEMEQKLAFEEQQRSLGLIQLPPAPPPTPPTPLLELAAQAFTAEEGAKCLPLAKAADEEEEPMDSEAELSNNGSRSPLLSQKRCVDSKQMAAERELRQEIEKVQKKQEPANHSAYQHQHQLFMEVRRKQKTEAQADSGCPSSDCEQVSASSKDLLLSADIEQGQLSIQEEEESLPSTSKAAENKSLGAIPKVVKYREVNEACNNMHRQLQPAAELHKRRSSSSGSSGRQQRSLRSAQRRIDKSGGASSSTSSHSIRDETLSSDMLRMLCVMHGGNRGLEEQERQERASNARGGLQLYEDAGMSLSERLFLREVMCSNASNQTAETDFVPADTQMSNMVARHFASAAPLNVSNAASLSIQGFISGMEEQQARSNSATNSAAAAAAILNVDSHNLENYCDYWRPACLLAAEKAAAPKSFYKYHWKFFDFEYEFKICMDRLELLALFDRDLHWLHICFSVILCTFVAYLGATILQLNYYKDLYALLFCSVIASAQYSLIKSVQPDAASPVHGFNKTVAYSRAIYFCLCGGLLLLFLQLRNENKAGSERVNYSIDLFGLKCMQTELLNFAVELMFYLLLCFPLIFSLGLFPQINTFLMYLLEQVDMHVFGGNAASSLLGALLCVLRSILGVLLLALPLYAALAENRGTQFIVFSIFCALLIPIGYHLSRSASDFGHIWTLIKNCIVSSYRDDDDELTSHDSATSNSSRKTRRRTKVAAASEQIEMTSLNKMKISGSNNAEETNLSDKRSKSKASSLGSSSQTLAGRTLGNGKRLITASNSFASAGGTLNEEQRVTDTQLPLTTTTATTVTDADDKVSNSSTTNAADISTLTAGGLCAVTQTDMEGTQTTETESPDPLPKKLKNTINTRLKNDLVVMPTLAVIILGLHCSTVFTVLQPDLNIVLYGFTGSLGLLLHYLIPQMRKHMPWLCFARPILRQKEYGQFEVTHAPKIMWFEKVYMYLCLVERNVLFPLLAISSVTADAQNIALKYGNALGSLIVAICSLKFVRNSYSDPTNQYLIVIFTVLLFRIDYAKGSETFLIDYFFISLAYRKCCDFFLKMQFIVTYIAPWQITWGSAFHAFAQPFSVPHSAMLFLQAIISAILSTPLNPFLGSAIFLTSYVRPIKFWERDYNTRRIDHSNTRLSSQLERDLGADDNNLNSIFYEHLTRSLQHSLCGDLLMGRWGNVNQGDCFVLASDYLNCLVHIIELGNGVCTFQMRGLEFRGTYCQQREVEAITEDVEDNDGCCCCDPGHLPRMLSVNAMFSTRWLAWQVVAAQYVLEGYSISDNLASATLQVFEYRKVLITYYVKSIIYYVIKSAKLEEWLASAPIQEALQHTMSRQFVDLDPIFNYNLDEDFDFRNVGITRSSFCYVYLNWINYCFDKRKEKQQNATNENNNINSNNNTPTNNNPTAVYNNNNDCKSTPNLAATMTPQAAKSHSTQQLRIRSQKSATMSNSSRDTEQIATSQSFANISRQTSESAPGLTGGMALDAAYSCTFATVGPTVAAKLAAQRQSLNKTTPTKGNNLGNNQKLLLGKGLDESAGANTSQQPNDKTMIKLKMPSVAKDSAIVSLCLALGLLARRSLATASHSSLTGVEFFLHGLHALFKGDFRITSPRDEWVFADMDLLHSVVAPAVKMALKLQQDHISNPDEYLQPQTLYEAIATCSKDLVISHEADPVWRSAVLRGAPNLLALRHVMEDGSDEYRIIRLTKRFLSFRVIKLNRECVRGLWAGQQQELIYLRNRNPERGSIQNAKQALRNIINSSCDQPIGYPIYVSPLTTSYADTNEQLCKLIGGPITLESIKCTLLDCWQRVRERCRQGCSSGSASVHETIHLGVVSVAPAMGDSGGDLAPMYISAPLYNTLTVGNCFGMRSGATTNVATLTGSFNSQYGSDSFSVMRQAGLAVMPTIKPNSSTLLAGFILREREMEREWETMREARAMRKSHTASLRAGTERERRATLPIASSSPHVDMSGAHNVSLKEVEDKESQLIMETQAGSPRFAKISCSSGSLGIGNIITTPGEYPRKSKGPICLTAGETVLTAGPSNARRPRIDLNKKVIIVDDLEIYDNLDLLGRSDLVWPNEEMRANGGRVGWKGWSPKSGMVGYVVHYWVPNHVDRRKRSHTNQVVYVVEIGTLYVPVGEYGLREYNQIVESSSSAEEVERIRSRRHSAQFDVDEYYRRQQQQQQQQLYLQVQQEEQQEREGLTPILGSSVESPGSHLANLSSQGSMEPMMLPISGLGNIKAVSSSSSEDEVGLLSLEQQKREMFFNMWKLITDNKHNEPITATATSITITTPTTPTAKTECVDVTEITEDNNINKNEEEEEAEGEVEFPETPNAEDEEEEEENIEEMHVANVVIEEIEEKIKEQEIEVENLKEIKEMEEGVCSQISIDESISDAAEYVMANAETPQEDEAEEVGDVLTEETPDMDNKSSEV